MADSARVSRVMYLHSSFGLRRMAPNRRVMASSFWKDADHVGAAFDLLVTRSRGLAEWMDLGPCDPWGNGMDASHPLIPEVGRVELDPRGPTASKCQVGRASSSQANRRVRDED